VTARGTSCEINGERLWAALMAMAEIGATADGGVRRLALSDEDRAARDRVICWFEHAGLAVRVDDLGNIYGRRAGTAPHDAPVVMGSHLDTVPTGGRFDGALGVLGALEVVRALDDVGLGTWRPLEVVCWTNEEGVRFSPAMLASGVISGQFTRDQVYAVRDDAGRTFGEELNRIGYAGAEASRLSAAAAYLELHIEQGPVLEGAGADVGIVEGVEGISWSRIEVVGRAAHAGPTPLADRRDALLAASRLVVAFREIAERAPGVRATVGRLEVVPNAINVVPGTVRLTADLRAPRTEALDEALAAVREACARTARDDGVTVEAAEFWRSPPTPFAPDVIAVIAEAARVRGYQARRLWAGAGHDAKYLADRFPSGMIFVPSAGGLSHNPAEWTAPDACARGAAVLMDAARALAERE